MSIHQCLMQISSLWSRQEWSDFLFTDGWTGATERLHDLFTQPAKTKQGISNSQSVILAIGGVCFHSQAVMSVLNPLRTLLPILYSKLEQTVLIWPQLWSYKFNLQGHLYGRRSSVKIQESMQGENRRGIDNKTPIKCLHMWFVWKQLLWDQKEICCFWQNW